MKLIDLFSGAGGFSLGFKMAGFETVLAIEKDLWAYETYKKNNPNVRILNYDITELKNLDTLSLKDVDCIIGGPPCQGFSLSGNRDAKDPRNSLFMEFVRFVKHFEPKVFVMENVPGLLSMKTMTNQKVIEIIVKEFKKLNYTVVYKVLNSAEYGVPQLRNRVFIMGTRNDCELNPEKLFPTPILEKNRFLTIQDAISDLPYVSIYDTYEEQDYNKDYQNEYQKWSRVNSSKVYNHVPMRHTKRLISRFEIIQEGQSLKDVPIEHMQRARGDSNRISGKVFSQNNMRPFYTSPSPTIAASFQSNYIHPKYNRNFTAREAARIQSFPDNYIFMGKRTTMSWEKHLSQYQQIGNAVPPLLAMELAKSIMDVFEKNI